MWLLNVHTLQLEHFVDEPQRKYAILSHTWEDEEVSFQEVMAGKGTEKKGWTKILGTCQQALADGYDYVWVDTCCINKESSAELSEAINSMWLWYCASDVCYALLVDLDEDCPELTDDDDWEVARVKDPDSWPYKFAQARWFTRSWTLQELIAPDHIEFFGGGWNYIGSKDSLLCALSTIAKIDQSVLEVRTVLEETAIARRMSWAASRSATRVEDVAYSLLGIFGISLPLLYGERDRAFIRLQEEIVRTSRDQSIFAWEYGGDDYLEHDRIFASSPKEFSHAGKVLLFEPEKGEKPFQLTNTGVRFDGLRISVRQNGAFGVLNCRYEDDFTGPIALKLGRIDTSMGQRESHFVIDEWITPDAKRTCVVDAESALTWGHQDCIILGHHPKEQGQVIRWLSPRIWCRENLTESPRLKILDAWPREQWNLKTMVWCPVDSNRGHDWELARAEIEDDNGIIFTIAFQLLTHTQVPSVKRLELPGRRFHHGKFRMMMYEQCLGETWEEVEKRLNSIPMTLEATIHLRDRTYHARTELSSIMGDPVYIVDIERE